MTKRIFETCLKAYQIRKPFKPFFIELVSGTVILVPHPEAVVTHRGAAVYFAPDGAITLFEASSVSRMLDARAPAAVKH
jgi:hypothetical protein